MKTLIRISIAIAILFACQFATVAQKVHYTIQIEALPSLEAAEKKVAGLKEQVADVYILRSQVLRKGIFYRVRIGQFNSSAEAKRIGTDLQAKGIVGEFFVAVFEAPKEELNPSTTTITDNSVIDSHSPKAIGRTDKKKFENRPTSVTEKPIRNYHTYITGPRGGCYYINGNGNKTYVERSLCR